MTKASNSTLWIEEGYNLFAHEGPEGIHIEKIARNLQLNKSAFYHYFGDLDGFCMELIQMHHNKADLFLREISELQNIDPEYLLLLVKHTPTVMFQVQLTRNQKNYLFYDASRSVDRKVNIAVGRLWREYLDTGISIELTDRYYNIIRDKFYTRVTFQNLNYQFLHEIASEAKGILDRLKEHKSHPKQGTLFTRP